MNLVNAHGAGEEIIGFPVLHPLVVCPLIAVYIPSYGRCPRSQLHCKGIGVGFDPKLAGRCLDLVLVDFARTPTRDKQLPYTGTTHRPHREKTSIPIIEIADYADPFGIWGPNRKRDPLLPFEFPRMSP